MGKVAEMKVGEILAMDVLKLKPTQFAVGLRQVRTDEKKMAHWSQKQIRRLIQKKPIPAVIGPKKRLYIVDHHHLASALYRIGERKAWVEILGDLSDLTVEKFWKRMERNHWVHLFDEKGQGPRAWKKLPKSVAQLKDDPYRSLAWRIRKRGGYFKTNRPFSDFQWANFFRERIKIDLEQHFFTAAEEGMKLALSPEAEGLPGYIRFEK